MSQASYVRVTAGLDGREEREKGGPDHVRVEWIDEESKAIGGSRRYNVKRVKIYGEDDSIAQMVRSRLLENRPIVYGVGIVVDDENDPIAHFRLITLNECNTCRDVFVDGIDKTIADLDEFEASVEAAFTCFAR